MKKLLIISPEYTNPCGGVAGYLRRLAGELSKDIEVDILTTAGGKETVMFGNDNLRIYKMIKRWDIFHIIKITDFIDKGDYGCINIQYVPQMYGWNGVHLSLVLLLFWCRLKRKRIFIYCHEIALPISLKYWYWFPFAIYNRIIYMLITMFSARIGLPLRVWTDKSAGIFFWMRNKFIFIPVFSNFETVYLTDTDKEAMRTELKLQKDEKILLFLGSLHPSKLLNYVVDALDYALEKGHKVRLICTGVESERVITLLNPQQQHLKDKIIATGFLPQDKLSRLLNIADIYLCPYFDGISTRRTSAMAGLQAGLATVSTLGKDTDLRIFNNSSLILADSKKAFIKNAERLLSDNDARKEISRHAHDLYENNFGLDKISKRYIECCKL